VHVLIDAAPPQRANAEAHRQTAGRLRSSARTAAVAQHHAATCYAVRACSELTICAQAEGTAWQAATAAAGFDSLLQFSMTHDIAVLQMGPGADASTGVGWQLEIGGSSCRRTFVDLLLQNTSHGNDHGLTRQSAVVHRLKHAVEVEAHNFVAYCCRARRCTQRQGALKHLPFGPAGVERWVSSLSHAMSIVLRWWGALTRHQVVLDRSRWAWRHILQPAVYGAGTCVEPFPLEFEENNRTCNLVRAVVSDTSGQAVSFVKPTKLSLGGIAATLSSANQVHNPNDTVLVHMVTVSALASRSLHGLRR
jgi:hypothetical protein